MDTQTSQQSWRPVVNGVLHSVQFDQLTDDLAGHAARELLRKPLASLTREEQYAALTTAVHTGTDLTSLIPDAHGEGEFRNFLTRVVDQLDALRPWPEPAYEEIVLSRWENFPNPVLIARLALSPRRCNKRPRASSATSTTPLERQLSFSG